MSFHLVPRVVEESDGTDHIVRPSGRFTQQLASQPYTPPPTPPPGESPTRAPLVWSPRFGPVDAGEWDHHDTYLATADDRGGFITNVQNAPTMGGGSATHWTDSNNGATGSVQRVLYDSGVIQEGPSHGVDWRLIAHNCANPDNGVSMLHHPQHDGVWNSYTNTHLPEIARGALEMNYAGMLYDGEAYGLNPGVTEVNNNDERERATNWNYDLNGTPHAYTADERFKALFERGEACGQKIADICVEKGSTGWWTGCYPGRFPYAWNSIGQWKKGYGDDTGHDEHSKLFIYHQHYLHMWMGGVVTALADNDKLAGFLFCDSAFYKHEDVGHLPAGDDPEDELCWRLAMQFGWAQVACFLSHKFESGGGNNPRSWGSRSDGTGEYEIWAKIAPVFRAVPMHWWQWPTTSEGDDKENTPLAHARAQAQAGRVMSGGEYWVLYHQLGPNAPNAYVPSANGGRTGPEIVDYADYDLAFNDYDDPSALPGVDPSFIVTPGATTPSGGNTTVTATAKVDDSWGVFKWMKVVNTTTDPTGASPRAMDCSYSASHGGPYGDGSHGDFSTWDRPIGSHGHPPSSANWDNVTNWGMRFPGECVIPATTGDTIEVTIYDQKDREFSDTVVVP